MMKGIWFDDIHSYEYLNLVLSKVNIPPAAVKTTYIDIPGGDGSLDLTEALGKVTYKDRECIFTFTVFPFDDFEKKKREVSNLLNGKRCKIVVDKDPDYYWEGRCFINEYASDKNLHKIVVGATVAPYKLRIDQTKVIVPAGKGVIGKLHNSRKMVVPTIITEGTATITVPNGKSYSVEAGSCKILDLTLTEGYNQVVVTSDSPVTFIYQEGDL